MIHLDIFYNVCLFYQPIQIYLLNKKVLHVKEKDQDPTTMIQQYKIRFQSHDPNGKLGYGSGDKKVSLGVPLFDIKISLSTDSEIAVAPSYIIFTKDIINNSIFHIKNT